jgi:hypothetical protein
LVQLLGCTSPKDILVKQALDFAEDVKSKGIAELREFYLAHDQKLLWCTWETDNPKRIGRSI